MIKLRHRMFYIFIVALAMMLSTNANAQDAAKDLFDQGQAAANQGNTARAIDFYEQSIDTNPDYAPTYSALALVYLENNGRLEDVVWLLQQAAELEPHNAEHYANMCRAYFQSQQFDWAESACLKALTLDANSASAQMSLAWIYLFGKPQPADAVKYFHAILGKVPNNPKIMYGLGMAYARNNQQAEALDVITNLRSMGQESLASQLEKMIRPGADIMMPPVGAAPIATVDTGPSKIVKSQPIEPKKVLPVDPNAPPPGTVRIQLRARLPSTDGSPVKKDDGEYTVDDYQPLTLKERQDRVKRMRGNSGRASGSGTVTTQTTGQ